MATTVLVVDDHFLFAQALAGVIKGMPEYELAGIAVTGPQSVALLSEHHPDVVLLDYHLPGYSADVLIPRMKALSPQSRIVVLTSDTSDAALISALRAGADGFLTKDKAIDDVVDALGAVVRGVPLLSPAQLGRAGLPVPPSTRAVAAPPPPASPPSPTAAAPAPPPPAVAAAAPIAAVARETLPEPLPATLPVPRPPRDAPLVVRLGGVASFAHAVRIERAVARLPLVRRVHLRKVDEGPSLGVRLRPGGSEADLARALREEPSVTDVASRTAELRLEARTDG